MIEEALMDENKTISRLIKSVLYDLVNRLNRENSWHFGREHHIL